MGQYFSVLCDDGEERCCLPKGNMRLKGIRSTSPVVIGDRVEVQLDCQSPETISYITKVADRSNYIIRRATKLSKQSHILASNIDASYLICTIFAPETSTVFIDRFLANAEAYRVPTELVFNKIDTLTEEGQGYLSKVVAVYEQAGYTCHQVSAHTGEGVEKLFIHMTGKINLLSGHSGVGKSSLINKLVPGANLHTANLSEAHLQGMHTTTFSQMISLGDCGGYLIDTPGIKGFGLIDLDKREVAHYFRELFHLGLSCRFANCTHTHEPNCAVQEALKTGGIAESRYQSYLSILADIDDDGRYRPEY